MTDTPSGADPTPIERLKLIVARFERWCADDRAEDVTEMVAESLDDLRELEAALSALEAKLAKARSLLAEWVSEYGPQSQSRLCRESREL